MDINDVQEQQRFEALVPGPDGANRFITIVGIARVQLQGPTTEKYTFRIGPAFESYQVLGVSCLPSVASLALEAAALAECSLSNHIAEFDVDCCCNRVDGHAAGASRQRP